jgi:membrane-associated phospholipid phosphatase
MAAVAAPGRTPLPRRSVPHLLLQLGGLGVLLLVAELLPRVFGSHDLATGVANARGIVDLERSLGIANELELARFGAEHGWVATAGDALYVGLHVPVMAGTLLWVYAARPLAFPWFRMVFVLAMVLTVAGYVLLPTAPPRFLPAFAGVTEAEPTADGAVNTLAAFPSGHVVFAVVASWAPLCLLRSRWACLPWALYPPFVGVLVVVTAHHWWLDVLAGVAVAVAARLLADRISPRAPRRPPPAPPGRG